MRTHLQAPPKNQGPDDTRRQLSRLKWLMTILPALAVFSYETVRHSLLESVLPTLYGNLIIGLVVLVLAYIFSELLFGIIERLQAQTLARSTEVTILNAIVEERERLSGELHDGLAQLVAYLLLRIDTVESLVADGRAADAAEELERLRESATELYSDVRDAISGLRVQVPGRGLWAALTDYLEEFSGRHGIAVDLQAQHSVAEEISPLAQIQLFRIVQEALANVLRHAEAQHVTVVLDQDKDNRVTLSIADDGRGLAPENEQRHDHHTYGLAMMRERAEGIGGNLVIASSPGNGTRVTVTVPARATSIGREGTYAASAR